MNFQEQAETFINEIQKRKRNPASEATVRKYRSNLKHALPLLGNRDLSQVNNGELKVLVAKMADEKFSASTINGVVTVVKLVVASALDAQGCELYPRTWNYDFIDVPEVRTTEQDAPEIGGKALSEALSRAFGQDKALYALLAGSGLRIGEARALKVGAPDKVNSTWDPETGTVTVHTTVVRDHIQPFPKTDAGHRQIDLDPRLNELLKASVTTTNGDLVFKSEVGGILNEKTAYERLEKVGIPGFHSLRRFRVTHLRGSVVPEGLIRFWVGHKNQSVTDVYDKTRDDIEKRKQLASQIGLGFNLEVK